MFPPTSNKLARLTVPETLAFCENTAFAPTERFCDRVVFPETARVPSTAAFREIVAFLETARLEYRLVLPVTSNVFRRFTVPVTLAF